MHRTVASIGGFAARRSGGAAAAARWSRHRTFHASMRRDIVKPFLLADIGEGIKEVQIIQWFVQPGARVEQFDKICEVQSDKASVDITSRFDGVIKRLHYEADAMAQVGKPLLDIDITGDIAPSDEKLLDDSGSSNGSSEGSSSTPSSESSAPSSSTPSTDKPASSPPSSSSPPAQSRSLSGSKSSSANLATPAVRGLLKEKNLDISEIQGTGRDGRVMKEDVHAHVAAQKAGGSRGADTSSTASSSSATPSPAFTRPAMATGTQQETTQNLSPIQSAMFKSMTKSLSIPHFLCADEVDLTALGALRATLNKAAGSDGLKLSALAFTIKAVSLALDTYPILNVRVDVSSGSPKLVYRSHHNVGVAMDTPQGLLVPNVKNVNVKSVAEIAMELKRLQGLASQGKLSNADLKGGTITVSNIGSIGGSYATPLLVEGEVAILATGRAKKTPRFDDEGMVEARDVAAYSWSADHRVVDGATVARAAALVKEYLEEPGRMVVALR